MTNTIELDNHILVFSKDRPDRLMKTMPSLIKVAYPIHLIDDSVSIENREEIRNLCKQFSIKYHGRQEQKIVIDSLNVTYAQKFIGRLGNNKWNLGRNRNYGIIYSILSGYKKVIFMDDDVVCNNETIDNVFIKLSECSFVGATIFGMPDHSIVGHIYRACGSLLPQYVSSTFIGIDLYKVKQYFINKYNEDWIWLFLENYGQDVPKIGSVTQLTFDPFVNWKSKIEFQEFGEILWNGLHYNKPFNINKLTNADHWGNILQVRKEEINRISTFSLPYNLKNNIFSIKAYLLKKHKDYSGKSFAKIFEYYFSELENWRRIVSIAKKTKGSLADISPIKVKNNENISKCNIAR